jgi:nitrite reductase (NADH) small subunit
MSAFVPVCPLSRLPVNRGVAALLHGEQVALFRTGEGEVHALSNADPFSGAMVLSRGIVGTRGDVPVVVSPMYKQAFSLLTGQCLDDPAVVLPTYPVRVLGGMVEVALRAEAAAALTA